ncbi:DUF4244 domain-containing protein [Kribbella sp. NPDC004875]|uniref:DUF4244 domain-containing protein n=1 Tax=Kribbella sp. NPDC004875 TaxID=3364107 RepID=UPI0036AD4CAF
MRTPTTLPNTPPTPTSNQPTSTPTEPPTPYPANPLSQHPTSVPNTHPTKSSTPLVAEPANRRPAEPFSLRLAESLSMPLPKPGELPVASCHSSRSVRRLRRSAFRHLRARTERGAATAEYAITIVAACGLGGVLVALLKSPVMMNALKALINYALKLAGVEGVHL